MEYEIVLYHLPLGKSSYPRPCVVLSTDTFELLGISTKPYEKFNYFTIHDHHPDFPATNLQHTSFVIGSSIARGTASRVVKKIGVLKGELAREFSDWIG